MRVIYIDVDSLRPDHLGAYGYSRPTSPTIDALANDALVMLNAFGSSSPCMPSRACLISGRFGIRHGVLTHWGPGSTFRFPGQGHQYAKESPTFTRHLREHGYRTVSFSSFMDRHQAFWFGAGWSEMNTFTLKQGSEDAHEVNAAVIPWLRKHAQATEDLFLHVQYWDPHRNYTVPPEWVDLVESAPIPEWLTDDVVADQQRDYGPYSARELYPFGPGDKSPAPVMPDRIGSLDDVHRFLDGYDGAIRFLDAQIGELLSVLDDLGILDDTAIILSADHGEALGEGGVYGDHTSAATVVHQVPMIIRWPGARHGATGGPVYQDGAIYQVDMIATICELVGIGLPPDWDATSFAPAVRGEEWHGRDQLVWDHALYSAQRVVRTPDWVYQRTYHPGLFEFEPVELYATADPHQRHNVASDHPDVVSELQRSLDHWRTEQLARTGLPDPMDEILATGGPFRYLQLDQWTRRLLEHDRAEDARRLLRSVQSYGRTRVA